jgi:hypothetical protein
MESLLSALERLTALPIQLWAIVAGTLASFGITQKLKFAVPAKWSAHAREIASQGVSFVSGFASTYLLWAGLTWDAAAFVVSLVVGLWSPALWNLGMYALGKYKPEWKEALSQQNRTPK